MIWACRRAALPIASQCGFRLWRVSRYEILTSKIISHFLYYYAFVYYLPLPIIMIWPHATIFRFRRAYVLIFIIMWRNFYRGSFIIIIATRISLQQRRCQQCCRSSCVLVSKYFRRAAQKLGGEMPLPRGLLSWLISHVRIGSILFRHKKYGRGLLLHS